MTPPLRTTLAALALAALAALAGTMAAAPAAAQTAPAPATNAAPAVAAAPAQDYARDIVMGQADAPVTLIEYGSFTCSHCAAFATDVFPRIKADYIDTGKVRYIHREVYFDRYGLWAGMVARCGGDLRYYGFVKTLYASQSEWAGSDDPAAVGENLRRLGRTAGLSDDELNACLSNNDMAQTLVTAYQGHAAADAIEATPTFLINGEKHANMSYEDFRTTLDAALK